MALTEDCLNAGDEMPPTYAYSVVDDTQIILDQTLDGNIMGKLYLPYILYRWQLRRYQPASGDRSYMIVSFAHPMACMSIQDPNVVVNDPFLRQKNYLSSNNRFEFILKGDQIYVIRVFHTEKYLRVTRVDGKNIIVYAPLSKATLWYVGPDRWQIVTNYFMPRVVINEWWPMRIVEINDINPGNDSYAYSTFKSGISTAKVNKSWYGTARQNTVGRFINLQVSPNKTFTQNNLNPTLNTGDVTSSDRADLEVTFADLSQNNMMLMAEGSFKRAGSYNQFIAFTYLLYYKIYDPKGEGNEPEIAQVKSYGWFFGSAKAYRVPYAGESCNSYGVCDDDYKSELETQSPWIVTPCCDGNYADFNPFNSSSNINNDGVLHSLGYEFFIERGFDIYKIEDYDRTCIRKKTCGTKVNMRTVPSDRKAPQAETDNEYIQQALCDNLYCLKNTFGECILTVNDKERGWISTEDIYTAGPVNGKVKELFRMYTLQPRPTASTIRVPDKSGFFVCGDENTDPVFSSYFTNINDATRNKYYTSYPYRLNQEGAIVSNSIMAETSYYNTSKIEYTCKDENYLLFAM